MRYFWNCFFFALCIAVTSCGCEFSLSPQKEHRLRVATYNTQLFFDAIEDGREFKEFRGNNSSWSVQKYETRLNRLCEALLLCGRVGGMHPNTAPDIIVLQEVESERVVRDLCNRLPQRNGHEHGVFVPPGTGAPFGCAILSRYPVVSVTAHDAATNGVSVRPLIEVVFDIQGIALTLFAVHWKSKLGDDQGKAIRHIQEQVLCNRIAVCIENNENNLFIACGDFNQTPQEFSLMHQYSNIWSFPPSRCNLPLEGTFWYDDRWEAIDHFFCSKSLLNGELPDIEMARVVACEPLLTAQNTPARYELYSGKGYSDHLPLVITLLLRDPD